MLEDDVEIGSEEQQSYAHKHDHSGTFHSTSEQPNGSGMIGAGQQATSVV